LCGDSGRGGDRCLRGGGGLWCGGLSGKKRGLDLGLDGGSSGGLLRNGGGDGSSLQGLSARGSGLLGRLGGRDSDGSLGLNGGYRFAGGHLRCCGGSTALQLWPWLLRRLEYGEREGEINFWR
jgi:hypothetical protein